MSCRPRHSEGGGQGHLAKWPPNGLKPAELAPAVGNCTHFAAHPPIVEEVSPWRQRAHSRHDARASVYIDPEHQLARVLKQIAARLEEKGIHMLDAPVSVAPPGQTGTLAVMVGGDKVVYERCLEIFRLTGKTICHCVRSARALKSAGQQPNSLRPTSTARSKVCCCLRSWASI